MIIPRISKAAVIAGTQAHLQPHRTATFARMGIDLVIGKREGYRVWDLAGRELFDLHLNGGTYNLGHRHPELVGALVEGVAGVDIGNHHFPSPLRLALAQRLSALAPAVLQAANQRVEQAITQAEVEAIYADDARLWEVVYRLKKLNRWWYRTVRRDVYPFLLAAPTAR